MDIIANDEIKADTTYKGKSCTTVTIGVIAYNEQQLLPALLDSFEKQTYPHELIDIILVDGKSSDNTKVIMENFANKGMTAFRSIRIYDNPKRIQAAGWNVVIRNYTTDVIIRIDAHAELRCDFVEQTMKCINSGEYVCGGILETIEDGSSKWGLTLKKAEDSLFGASIGKYKRQTEASSYVDTVPFAAYRREVTDRVGLFNENLLRTEDNEYHYRIRKSGYRICCSSHIRSRYVMRSSLRKLNRQKYGNGEWIGRTLLLCPGCISWYHLVPGLFVTSIMVTTGAAIAGRKKPARLLWGSYSVVNILMNVTSGVDDATDLCLPLIFLSLHTAYGAGTLKGITSEAVSSLRKKLSGSRK